MEDAIYNKVRGRDAGEGGEDQLPEKKE